MNPQRFMGLFVGARHQKKSATDLIYSVEWSVDCASESYAALRQGSGELES
ncbi:MAG: hypothetical protein NTV80_13330 [Verrucomicrobia bacterium]|nr:hypothetical protein [Verrucomicrobiota bacterium]